MSEYIVIKLVEGERQLVYTALPGNNIISYKEDPVSGPNILEFDQPDSKHLYATPTMFGNTYIEVTTRQIASADRDTIHPFEVEVAASKAPKVYIGSTWRPAQAYSYHNGNWARATVQSYKDGEWKELQKDGEV